MTGERMAPHVVLREPLVEAHEPSVNPIAAQSGLADQLSPDIPQGVSIFDISGVPEDPAPRENDEAPGWDGARCGHLHTPSTR